MDKSQCLIGGCDVTPTRELIVDTRGLLLVYSVCADHKRAIRSGALLAETAELNRGLIGPAPAPPL